MTEEEGPSAPDNIRELFPGQRSAAPVPPQPDVIEELQQLLSLAQAGKITGLVWIGVDAEGRHAKATCGKVPLNTVVTALEQLKFSILLSDYTLSPPVLVPPA